MTFDTAIAVNVASDHYQQLLRQQETFDLWGRDALYQESSKFHVFMRAKKRRAALCSSYAIKPDVIYSTSTLID